LHHASRPANRRDLSYRLQHADLIIGAMIETRAVSLVIAA
jgi:hypothetical protein